VLKVERFLTPGVKSSTVPSSGSKIFSGCKTGVDADAAAQQHPHDAVPRCGRSAGPKEASARLARLHPQGNGATGVGLVLQLDAQNLTLELAAMRRGPSEPLPLITIA
jgi:hypothetical protein